MSIGVVWGLVFGFIPGLSAIVGMAIFLPFVFFLPAEHALPLMVAMGSVVFTGGSISAILLNVPGTGANAATLIDGFPMTQQGKAGRALGAALVSSASGGVLTVFFALAMIPLVLMIVMGITSADTVFIVLLGIAFIAVLGAGSMVTGLISGCLGLLISFVGFENVSGMSRFTFGSVYLYEGIALVPLALALFAIPEMIALTAKGGTISVRTDSTVKGMSGVLEGAKDVFRHWGLWLRCSVIGYIIGIIPGIGGAAATFIAYGQAKQISKYPEKFGTGVVEGVIAPESANNAKEAGALLTTLALGIPGSAEMAVLLGGLLMVGLIPGPAMLTEHIGLSMTLILVIVAANVMGVLICLPLAHRIAKIAMVPARLIVPVVTVLVFVGAFSVRQELLDLVVILAFAVLGMAMRQFGFNRPALFLGFVLGRIFENYLFIALQISGPLFFMRPISLTLIVLIVAIIAYGPVRGIIQRKVSAKKYKGGIYL
ncbi:tripartite tricarboxylate transporter permease [Chloroflexota bacterium]